MNDTSTNPQTVCIGIDVGKAKLDIATTDDTKSWRDDNTAEGHARLVKRLKGLAVDRVGLEATGGYEAPVVEALREAGFTVAVLQPRQVKHFGLFKGKRAKNDRVDAELIARCTAALDKIWDAPDPRLAPFAEHLTRIEQIEEDLTRAKIRRERFSDPHCLALLEDDIKRLSTLRRQELARLFKAIRAHEDLAAKIRLLISIPGLGLRTALALVVRMPELGTLTREEAASLIGAAPFVHQSGRYDGQRRTGGGRARPRTSLFAAAQAAARLWNPDLIKLYKRLTQSGKPHAVAIIACVRKLVIYANTVLARQKPWTEKAV